MKGNIVGDGWYRNVKTETGKTDVEAIVVLADIVSWANDKEFTQSSYQNLMEKLCLNKIAVKKAVKRLVKLGLIQLEWRMYYEPEISRIVPNAMFVKLNSKALAKIAEVK